VSRGDIEAEVKTAGSLYRRTLIAGKEIADVLGQEKELLFVAVLNSVSSSLLLNIFQL